MKAYVYKICVDNFRHWVKYISVIYSLNLFHGHFLQFQSPLSYSLLCILLVHVFEVELASGGSPAVEQVIREDVQTGE